ncbi:MAG: HAD family hydrolase [Arachnia sp.]
MSPRDRAVFWDFDGTLAVREGRWSGALLDAWRLIDPTTSATADHLRPHLQSGFPWHDADTTREAPSAAEWWAALRPMFVAAYTANGLDSERADAAAARVPDQYYQPDTWSVVSGAEEALRLVRDAGYRNIILSNHAPELPELVRALGLADLVEMTITSACVGAEKPNPAIFRYATKAAGLTNTGTAWMVGDNPIADVQGALNAGIRAILADGGEPGRGGMTVVEAAHHIRSHRPTTH